MAASWKTSYPSVPHSTPSSVAKDFSVKSLKPPIYNPYDKFTRPEFDQWIGGITSALRKALGQEEAEEAPGESDTNNADPVADTTFGDEEFEDSFAEIRSRQAKGKARDPREGPGLGGQQNPIELLSDSEEERSEGEEEGEYGGREEYDDYDDYEQGEEGQFERRDTHEDYEEDVDAISVSSREESPEIVELSSGEEEDDQGAYVRDEPAGPHDTEGDADADDANEYDLGADARYRGRMGYMLSRQQASDDIDGHVSKSEHRGVKLDTRDEDQPNVEDEDTEFPPLEEPSQPVELSDPWQGPRTYAEDFYSGGDFRAEGAELAAVSPSQLTPVHDAYEAGDIYDPTLPAPLELTGATPEVIFPPVPPRRPEPEIITVDVEEDNDDQLPNSSPPPSSPSEERASRSAEGATEAAEIFNNILDDIYADAEYRGMPDIDQQQFSVTQSSFGTFLDDAGQFAEDMSFRVTPTDAPSATAQPLLQESDADHLNWNWPPAFPQGKVATRAGHLKTSPSQGGIDEFLEDDDAEVSDAENEGPIPLGTSDLAYDELEGDERQAALVDDAGEEEDELLYDDVPEGHQGEFVVDADQPTLDYDDNAAVQTIFDLISGQDAQFNPSVTSSYEGGSTDLAPFSPASAELSAGAYEVPTDVLDADSAVPPPEVPSEQSVIGGAAEPRDPSPQGADFETQGNDEALFSPRTAIASSPEVSVLEIDVDSELTRQSVHYTVIEAQTDLDPSTRQPSQDVDVVSFAGDVAEYDRTYEVVEPLTGVSEEPAEVTAPPGVNEADVTVADIGHAHTLAEPMTVYPQSPQRGDGGNTTEQDDFESHRTDAASSLPKDVDTAHSGVIDATVHERPSTPARLPTYPMPVSADPSVPDPIVSPRTSQQTPPRLINVPGTPRLVLSPHTTPGLPTPVAIPIPASMLQALSRGASVSDVPGSGLFTPQNGEADGSVDISVASSTTGNEEAPKKSADDLVAGVTTALTEDAQPAEEAADAPTIDEETSSEDQRGEFPDTHAGGNEVPDRDQISVLPSLEKETPSVEDPLFDGHDSILGAQTHVSNKDGHAIAEDASEAPESQELLGHPGTETEAEGQVQLTVADSIDAKVDHAEPVSDADIATGQGNAEIAAEDGGHDQASRASIDTTAPKQPLVQSEESAPVNPQPDDDPFKFIATESTMAPEPAQDDPLVPPGGDVPVGSLVDSMQSFTNVPVSHKREGRLIPVNWPTEGGVDFDELTEEEDSDTGVTEQPKPLKRKRTSSIPKPNRLTRSLSATGTKRASTSGSNSSSKGKEKADVHDHEEGYDAASRHRTFVKDDASDYGSTSSGASAASKILLERGSNGSRASSVLSSAPSESSSVIQPLQPPIFHAHGGIHHHHHHRPLAPPVPPRSQPAARVLTSPQLPPEGSESPTAAIATPSSSTKHITFSSSSPVTRSNCRFHKISLPKEEGGPRVCFVVPGCSLGDGTLMDDEEIQDHGPATYDDYSRLLGNIESLDFSSYLIGVLRQLVGVDLLRENEVYYLLQPGEESHYKKMNRKSSSRSKRATRDGSSVISRSIPGSPLVSATARRSPASSLRPPISAAGSMSTSIASSRSRARLSRTDSHSISSSSDGEATDQEQSSSRNTKRRRRGSNASESAIVDTDAVATFSKMEKKAVTSNQGIQRRRSKRLGNDAAAYQPEAEEGEGSADEVEPTKNRRKPKQKHRGTKRSRGREVDEEVNHGSRTKKRKNDTNDTVDE